MPVRPYTGILFVIVWTLLMAACDREQEPEFNYTFETPETFPASTYTFENNPLTKEGFELGRMLFYDPILSVDNTVSCSTCHRQETAFADPTHRVNHGINNRLGKRNSPGIANMAFMNAFFYDGGVNHLDFVPVNAITSEVEMGNTLDNVVTQLNNNTEYREKFRVAFNKEAIDSQQVLHALSQFTVMLVSANAKYDKVQRKEETFTTEEAAGFVLFQENCSVCHGTSLFTHNEFRNNGLDNNFKDLGREVVTEMESDRGKFKVPSLRNVALTPPYMHDGRFASLDAVMNHYANGVKDSPTLDPMLNQDGVLGIALSEDEQSKIISFLKTLSDTEFTKDKRFEDPF